jgi:DNA-binding MarR family transcriptional regulator
MHRRNPELVKGTPPFGRIAGLRPATAGSLGVAPPGFPVHPRSSKDVRTRLGEGGWYGRGGNDMEDTTGAAGRIILDAMQDITRRSAPAISDVTKKIRRVHGVTVYPSLFRILGELGDGASRSTQLADAVGVSQSTMSLHLRELQRNGLITRSQDESDSRSSIIQLSDKGRQVWAMVEDLRESVFGRVFAGWSEEEVSTLADLLVRLRDEIAKRNSGDSSAGGDGAVEGREPESRG